MLERRFSTNSHADFTGINPQGMPWLLLSLALAALLHIDHTPIWLNIALVGILLWRIMVFRGRFRLPQLWVKVILLLLGITLFLVSSKGQFTIENAVGFFLLTYGLKLLETGSTRDAYLFVFMTLFLMPLGFLFSQSIFATLFIFVSLAFAFIALMGINGSLERTTYFGALKRAFGLFAWALPILVVAYIVFPRLGPIWSMPLNSTSAFTGLSDSMMPGQVANLAQSSERAFRADFDGPPPPSPTLYWRALAMDLFTAGQWSRSNQQRGIDESRMLPQTRLRRLGLGDEAIEAALSTPESSYEILLDPHNRDWGFSLNATIPTSRQLSGQSSARGGAVLQTLDGLIRFGRPVKSPSAYTLQSLPLDKAATEAQSRLDAAHIQGLPDVTALGSTAGLELTDFDRRRLLQLPAEGNPLTRKFAAELREQHDDQAAFIYDLLNYFRTEPFTYTLNPPVLDPESNVDDFMFGERRGFCEHFASATAVILRSAGIPARIMTGYQGGEFNSTGGFLVVRQYDAHAWVEAWLEGIGWVRVDPTAAVSPLRIEAGLRTAVAEEGGFLSNEISLSRFSGISALNWIDMRLEYTNYLWQKWVINYDQKTQQSLLATFFGDVDIRQIGFIATGAIAGIIILIGLMQLMRGRRHLRAQDPVVRLYDRLLRRLRRAGADVSSMAITPRQLCGIMQSAGADKETAMAISQRLERLLYARRPQMGAARSRLQTNEIRQLRSLLRKLNLRKRSDASPR
ncbi:transglutaminaseTgpA domain-containing protein [Allohahella sp. A8]|uniref:transglutaminase family protein n=1 Tax=Allohahella sp. A8 TaxID=3141461 RepID=UPI003A7FB797